MPETSIISEHTTSQSTMSRSESSESSKASSHSESSQSLHASHCVAHSTHSWPKRAHVIEYHTIRLEILAKNQGIGCVQIFFDCKIIVDLVILSEIIIIKSIVLLAHLFSDIYYSGETQMHRDQMFGFAIKNTLSCKDMIFGMLYQNKVKVIVYQYLIMLIKLSLKYRSFLPLCYSTNALRFSTINQKKTELQRMRNRDYKSQRTKLIEAYNQQLKKERQKFSKRMLDLKINKSTQNFLNEFYQEKHDQFSVQAQNYKDKITFLSSKLKNDLTQIDQEEKTNTVKIYLTDHIKDQESTSSFVNNNENYQTGGFYIPNRFILKKMYLCNQKLAKNAKPGQQLLLAGVQSEQDHCLFLNKLFKEFNIKNVVTMVPPDLPFFLKTEDSFAEQWRKLLEDGNYAKKVKFYVNPKPKTLDQIVLHSHYSPYVRASLGRSSAFLDTHYYLMQQNQLSGNYEPLPLMTGLCNQNVQKNYIADFPVFQQRKMLANSISLQKLRQLFQLHLKNIRENKLNFSAQWLFPKEVLKKKLSHLLKVARAVTQVGDGRTILICPAQIAQLLSIQWQIGNKQNKLRFNYQDGKHYLDFGQQEEKEGEQTFIQFVQKLVILDVIMDQPVISKYFVKYKSFPFLCHHTIGGRENIGKIFIIWMHFYKTYYETLTEKRLLVGKDAQRRAQYFSKFQNPQDFH